MILLTYELNSNSEKNFLKSQIRENNNAQVHISNVLIISSQQGDGKCGFWHPSPKVLKSKRSKYKFNENWIL